MLADELRAPAPSAWSWVLNTFEAPTIDAKTRDFTRTQRGEQRWGRHVFPETLHCTSSNERKYPLLSRQWTRVTEAFPEPWRMQVTTEKTVATEFLTVMQPFQRSRGRSAAIAKSVPSAATLAVSLSEADGHEDVLMRRPQDAAAALGAWNLRCDDLVLSAKRSADGELTGWVAAARRDAPIPDGRRPRIRGDAG